MAKNTPGRLAPLLARLRRRPTTRSKAIAGVVVTRAERQQQQNQLLAAFDRLILRYDRLLEAARRSNREAEVRLRGRRKPSDNGTRST